MLTFFLRKKCFFKLKINLPFIIIIWTFIFWVIWHLYIYFCMCVLLNLNFNWGLCWWLTLTPHKNKTFSSLFRFSRFFFMQSFPNFYPTGYPGSKEYPQCNWKYPLPSSSSMVVVENPCTGYFYFCFRRRVSSTF